jgi:hypothetical protein
MHHPLGFVAICLALGLAAIGPSEAQAREPHNDPYCAVQNDGATVCHFRSHALCDRAATGRCIDNPAYLGPIGAMARTPIGRYRSPWK